ncbi:MAG: 50S ribosomal protein L23 [Ignavibacteria bacterium]|nr:50S ribosomal protein L23 [Ignavibacteria bacterium]
MSKQINQILIRPLLTEKLTALQDKGVNVYGFEVARNANKIEIANAVEKKFNVKVINVRTVVRKGKTKTQFTRSGRFTGRTATIKKAYVTLAEGQKIDFFENI